MTRALLIRAARTSDLDAVLQITSRVWGGRDYIRYVWDDWLTARAQPLLIGELAGEPVAIARLGDLGNGEGWFQGLRVAEQARGQGIGRRMLETCLLLSRQRGDRSLRLMTDGDNAAMQHMATAAGLRLEIDAGWLRGPPLERSRPVSMKGDGSCSDGSTPPTSLFRCCFASGSA